MKSTLFAYYLLLALLVAGSALNTVVVGSRHIDFGQRVSLLEQEKRQLQNTLLAIEKQQSTQLSLSSLSNDALALGYQPISGIIRVDKSAIAASR